MCAWDGCRKRVKPDQGAMCREHAAEHSGRVRFSAIMSRVRAWPWSTEKAAS